MASKLVNIGHAVARLFGSNFSSNEVEEIGSTNNTLWTTIKDSTGNEATVNESGQLHVVQRGTTDSGNSKGNGDNLIADEVFTGTSIDVLDYGGIGIQVHSDVAGTMKAQFSPDNIEWREGEIYDIIAGGDKFFTPTMQGAYFRVVYTNGGTATSDFGIHTVLHKTPIKWSSHNIDDPIVDQDDAELVKSVNTGKDQNGIYQNNRVTEIGAQLTADFLVEVSRNNIPGYKVIRKFGYNPNITAATDADVYEWGKTAGAEKYTFSADGVADIDRMSSDSAADTGISVTIEGLDVNGLEVTQTVPTDATNGQTPVAITPLNRVNRAFNANGTSLAGNIYIFVNGAVTGGIPNTVTDVRGYFSIAEGQTLQGIYTVPAGKKAYMYGLKPSIVKKQAAFATLTQRNREFGKVLRTQDKFGLTTTGTSKSNDTLEIPAEYAGRTDIIPEASVDSTIGFSISYILLLIDD